MDICFNELKQKLLNTGIVYDNEYLDKYIKLILQNKETERIKNRTNRHHIIPRFYYKHNGLRIDNSLDNIVNLLYKDHILAHYYLCLCSNDNALRDNFCAISYILHQPYFSINETCLLQNLDEYQQTYEKYKQLNSSLQKGKVGYKHTAESRAKISIANKGRIKTEQTKQKISKALFGKKRKPHSDATKEKMRMAALKRYSDPEERRKQSERSKISNNRPGMKELQSKLRKQYYENTENRIAQSERFKSRKVPWHYKSSKKLKQLYIDNPELRIRRSIEKKEYYKKHPETIEKIRCAMIRYYRNN